MKLKSDKTIKVLFLEFILKWMAKIVLLRHNPKIIGVTGSIGKTTTKEAIYHLIKNQYKTREAKKNFNNEIGVPLTIIGYNEGMESFSNLLNVFILWLKILFGLVEYPKILVLEMAIDRPGDMDYLLSIVKVDIAVVNHITNVHREFFENINQIAKEKGKIVEQLKSVKSGFVILNEDDSRVKKMTSRTGGIVLTYGYSKTADLYASDVYHIFENNKFKGISFKLNYDGKIIPIRLNYVLAEYHVYAILAAIAVANVLKINIIELADQISSFRPPLGRMNLIDGVKHSSIIDDTYNASPKAVMAAIDTLVKIPSQRKIVVLGDMLELGEDEIKDHKFIIKKLYENDIEAVFLVGRRMQEAFKFFEDKDGIGMNILFFDNPIDAGNKLKDFIKEGDLILVKGSQGMRMEKVVEQIIEDKKNMSKLLCRQNFNWKEKPYKMP